MPRLVAIDFGAKRTGIAVTDPLQLIASALETIPSHTVVAYLKKYVQTEPVEGFVVGMPKRLDGTDTDNTPRVKSFVRALQNAFPETPVHLHDERFTSKMALQAMIASGSTKKDRREKSGNIDKVSAAIILQSFMEQHQR
ncbi:Holliday junction resolvase RuvX [Rudanella paleaurantiibacter]|uniref:Putative pre-16S rRNA nuclease n=1 Tax=Rudanella paleaurantiibacter TaxID=2614655 RepID=A0A7J5TZ96_9BACT|nr:Holliday junction resolvase RuvX [Rudanella paleaurantiibacter]KAB7730462.1 Holliday junction resolvase RuvX [Rudanella paleaurantiibacter]